MRVTRITVASILAISVIAGGPASVASQDDVTDGIWPRLTEDLVYGEDDSARQVIHVWEPKPRAGRRPAVVFFHGGGLVMGTPLQDLIQAQALADMGYVSFMAGYRLFDERTGENPWPAQLEDAQRAIQWIRGHAEDFNVDPDRVCAVGHSSGGHLASLLGMTEASGATDGESSDASSRVDCVVTVAGDVDLMVPQGDQYMRTVLDRLLGGTVEEVPNVWRAASPAHNVDDATVPFLIIHGSRDEAAPLEGSRNLADALSETGVEYVFAEVPAGHMDVWGPEATRRLVEAFLAYQLHPEE